MSDSALRERLSKNAIRIPEKFSIEEIGQKWTTLFEKITQQTNLNS